MTEPLATGRPCRLAVVWSSIFFAATIVAGCNAEKGDAGSGSSQPLPSANSESNNEAEQILSRMIAAYGDAISYADRGELRIRFIREGRPVESTVPFSVALARPNRLQMHLYQGHAVCDGRNLWGWTEDLPGYLLKRPAPPTLTLSDLYADEVMRAVLSEGQVGGSLQLAMMLGTDAMRLIRAGGEPPELLSDDYQERRPCRRVRIRRDDGNLVYWIDRETLVLRRIDFPTNHLALTLAEPIPLSDLTFTAEFHDPELNPQISPEAFQFDPPPSAKIVDNLDSFISVPPPQPPAETLGKKIGDFQLARLDGKPYPRAELADKTAVVYFWSLGVSQSLAALDKLNETFLKYKDRRDVAFLAINIDSSGADGISDEGIRDVLQRQDVTVPTFRDPAKSAAKALDARYVPNLYLIAADGTVQDNEIGLNRQLEIELPARIERIVKGESLVADCRSRYEERLAKYEESQRSQAAADGAASIPQAVIAPAAEPKTLKLARLWHTTDVAKPGYVLAVGGTEPTRVIVADGLRGLVELNERGETVRKQELDLPRIPTEAVISFWRTAVTKQGKRIFLGSASAQQQLHLFDADFQRLLSYPEGTHAGISDVQLGDLDGDGEPEINIGYWGVVGVQNVSLDGTRRWSNRRLPENVLRLAVSSTDSQGKRLLFCNTGLMTAAVVDDQGETVKEMLVGSRAMRLIAAEDLNHDGRVELCGIATMGPGTDVAVGFGDEGTEHWNYPLPRGVQPAPEMQNEMIVGGKLLAGEPGLWVFAGADGTVHLVSAEGKPIDFFGWGAAVHGLALAAIGSNPVLILSDAKGVTALRISR